MRKIRRIVLFVLLMVSPSAYTETNITVTAPVTVVEDFIDGVSINDDDSTITNQSDVNTEGFFADAIVIIGQNATITSSAGNSAGALGDQSDAIAITGDNGLIINDGTASTEGDDSATLFIEGDIASIINGATGVATAAGNASGGMILEGNSGDVSNNGLVLTTGDSGVGMGAFNGNDNDLFNRGDVTTTGVAADAMRIDGQDGFINNSATGIVSTTGATLSNGLLIIGDGGSIGNQGAVSITGDDAGGIRIIGNNGSITSSGSVTSGGTNAPALIIEGLDASLGSIAGSTATTTGDASVALFVLGDGGSISHSGSSSTSGVGSTALEINGLDAFLGTSSGSSTTTTGDQSIGIFVFGDAGTIVSGGSVSTSGATFAHGAAITGNNGGILNDGSVVTNGSQSLGLFISGDSGSATNRGDVTTNGLNAPAIQIDGLNAFIRNGSTGSLTATGDGGSGIAINGDSGFANNDGSILVMGAGTQVSGAFGIVINGANATITNSSSGVVTTNGANSVALAAFGDGGMVVNDGSLLGNGINNRGINLGGNGFSVTNTGSVLVVGDGSVALGITGTSNTVTNTGTGILEAQSATGTAVSFIDSAATDTNTLINLGAVNATASGFAVVGGDGAETIDNSGTIDGNVLLGGGDDTFILRDLGEVLGIIDGEAGVDSLEIDTGANDRTLDGSLFAGFDLFTKSGSGTLFTTGIWDLGTGNINLAGGQIALQSGSGMIFDTITLNPGGTLSGPGTIDGDIINQGGNLTPAGTLTVLGSYTQTSGSLNFSIAGSNPGEFDVLSTTGDIDLLGGSLNIDFTGGFVPMGESGFTLLESQGDINIDPGVAFNVGSGQVAFEFVQSISFPVDPGTGQQFQLTSGTFNFLDTNISETIGLTGNEGELAEAFDDICLMNQTAGNLTPAEQDLVDACRDIRNAGNTPDQVMQAIEALDTEEVTQTVNSVLLFTIPQHGNLSQRVNSLRSGSDPFRLSGLTLQYNGQPIATVDIEHFFKTLIGGAAGSDDDFSKWTVFGNANFNFGEQSATENGNGFDSKTITALLGVDYRLRDNLVVGGSFSYSQVNADFKEGGGMDLKSWAGSVFASFFSEKKYYIDVLATYGLNDLQINRRIIYSTVMGGTNRRAKSDTNGHQSSTAIGVGYDFTPGAWVIGPHGGANYTAVKTDGYTEEGAGGLNLSVNTQHATSFTSNLGVHVSYTFTPRWGVITPYIRADWVHEFQSDSETINVRFEADRFSDDPTNPSLPIRVETDERDENYYVYSAGASVQLIRGVAGFINYRTTRHISDFDLTDLSWGIRMERSW